MSKSNKEITDTIEFVNEERNAQEACLKELLELVCSQFIIQETESVKPDARAAPTRLPTRFDRPRDESETSEDESAEPVEQKEIH